jgi:hypothetical protein
LSLKTGHLFSLRVHHYVLLLVARSSSMSEAAAAAATAPAPAQPVRHLYFYGRRTQPCKHDKRATTDGSLVFLSNFFPASFRLGKAHTLYASSEHYYQAAKFQRSAPEHAERIRQAKTATEAKRLGQSKVHKMRADWHDVRVRKMRKALRAKFTQNAELATKLLATGDARLHEDAPADKFFGVCGEDQLGRLLVQLRAELVAAAATTAAAAATVQPPSPPPQ